MNENERTQAETAADYAVHFCRRLLRPLPLLRQGSEKPGQRIHQRKRKQWNGRSARVTAQAQKHGSSSAPSRMDSPLRGREDEGGPLRAYRLYGPLYRIRLQCIPPGTLRLGNCMPTPLTCTQNARTKKRNGQSFTQRPQLCGTAASWRHLPYWEPPTYKTGSCCFCGQLRVLPFAAPTQEEADQYATDKCDCEIGKACRRQREEREIIAGLFR